MSRFVSAIRSQSRLLVSTPAFRPSPFRAMSAVSASQIKKHMPVVGSDSKQFATVDHMDGTDTIKLTKGDGPSHHYIPLSWVQSIDDKVHVNKTAEQAKKEWKDEQSK